MTPKQTLREILEQLRIRYDAIDKDFSHDYLIDEITCYIKQHFHEIVPKKKEPSYRKVIHSLPDSGFNKAIDQIHKKIEEM